MASLQNKTTFNGLTIIGKSNSGYSSTQLIMGFGLCAAGQAFTSTSSGIFIGSEAGRRVCSITSSVVIGSQALCTAANATNIDRSTIIGGSTAKGRCTLQDIVAIGYGVLNQASSTCQQKHVLIGANSTAIKSFSYTTSQNNIIIGNKAAYNMPYGNNNIIIGYCAAQSTGVNCINSENVIIGWRAGQQLDYNSRQNTIVGAKAGSTITGYRRNMILFGYNNYVSDSDHAVIGNSNTTRNRVSRSWTITSDSRDKIDIAEIDENLGLNFIRKLKPISYKYNDRKRYVNNLGFEYGESDGSLKNPQESYGFSAQDMKETLDELAVNLDALNYNISEDSYRLTYNELISPIVKSIQETITRLERVEKLAEDKNGMF